MDFLTPSITKWFDKVVALDKKGKATFLPEKIFAELSKACLVEGSPQSAKLTGNARGVLLRMGQEKKTANKKKKKEAR
jgi:hypothetical protein